MSISTKNLKYNSIKNSYKVILKEVKKCFNIND